ncbi:MAG: hypothetical protein WCS52_13835 [bacterium]
MMSLVTFLVPSLLAGNAQKPAILIIDNERGGRNYWNPLTLQEMLDAGYEVGMCPRDKSPTVKELQRYNIVLLAGLPPHFDTDLLPKLESFMEQGGGVLVVPSCRVEKPLEGREFLKWLQRLGATIYFQGVEDPERRQVVDWCKWPGAPEYIWTSEIAESPITRGVKTLWHRSGPSAHYTALSAPLTLDGNWTPLVFTGSGSRAVSWAESPFERDTILSSAFKATYGDFVLPQGQPGGRLPLLAVRARGQGRLAIFSVNPQDLFWSPYIPAQGGVMLHRGFKDRPSDGWTLLNNVYGWLAEPSLAGTALGGAKTVREQLFRKPVRAPESVDWKQATETGLAPSIPGADSLLPTATPMGGEKLVEMVPPVPRGLAGAHSAYSSGSGTVAEWVTAAKASGLDFIIFMEDMGKMNAGKWEKLKAECAALSDDQFTAYPGMEFEHENFTRGYFFNRHWLWLVEENILTRDRRFIQTSRNVPSSEAGPLILWLAYEQPFPLRTLMTLGFFSHQSNLTPAWAHRAFGSMSIFTRDRKGVIDDIKDTLPVFLRLQSQKLVISPMALSLMSDPSEIAGVVKRGGPFVTTLGGKKNIGSAIDTGGTYCYGGRASAICATTGPQILNWSSSQTYSYVIPRWDVARREEDFFAIDNYRYRIRLAAQSPVGLKEIVVYDGDQGVYRRFLPDGKKQFEATLDLSNGQSRHLVLVVKDQAGGIAVSPEIQTENWLNRHYLCADRCNFGTGNQGQGAWYTHPGPYTTQQGRETMLMARWARPVISADVLALKVNLDTRIETAGAFGYGFGKPWTTYYRTWPMEEMTISKTDYRWRGDFGGSIFYLEEYFPGAIDTIWDFPKPLEPFYPENRGIPNQWTIGLPDWKRIGHSASEVILTAPVTFQEPWVSALRETRDYVNGQGSYDFRISGKRLSGSLPVKGAPPLEQTGDVPESGLFALTSETGKTGACWLVTGKGLTYKLSASNGKATLDVGWPVADAKAEKGTAYRWEVYALSGPPSEVAINELLAPSGLKAGIGALVTNRFPYTFIAAEGAVTLKAEDLRSVPCEWIPLEVRGLTTRRTAYWHEIGTNRVRPIGVDPDGVGRVVLWRGKHGTEFFCGHPISCSDPELWYDAVRMANGEWIIDVNNPTDKPRAATFAWNAGWSLRGKLPDTAILSPGGRQKFTIKEEK